MSYPYSVVRGAPLCCPRQVDGEEENGGGGGSGDGSGDDNTTAATDEEHGHDGAAPRRRPRRSAAAAAAAAVNNNGGSRDGSGISNNKSKKISSQASVSLAMEVRFFLARQSVVCASLSVTTAYPHDAAAAVCVLLLLPRH